MDDEGLEQTVAALEAELAKARAKEKAGEPYVPKKPWRRHDPTEGMRMSAAAVRAMVEAVPDMRGIAREQGRVSVPGMFPTEQGKPVVRGSGWREPRPLEPPPGVAICDQMVDVQDALDRRDLEKRLGGR